MQSLTFAPYKYFLLIASVGVNFYGLPAVAEDSSIHEKDVTRSDASLFQNNLSNFDSNVYVSPPGTAFDEFAADRSNQIGANNYEGKVRSGTTIGTPGGTFIFHNRFGLFAMFLASLASAVISFVVFMLIRHGLIFGGNEINDSYAVD